MALHSTLPLLYCTLP